MGLSQLVGQVCGLLKPDVTYGEEMGPQLWSCRGDFITDLSWENRRDKWNQSDNLAKILKLVETHFAVTYNTVFRVMVNNKIMAGAVSLRK